MTFDRLLAKSIPSDENDPIDSVFLSNHLRDAYAAAQQIVACTGDDQLAALGLEPSRWRSRLKRVVTLAAALHDLGKANEHFQRMVRRQLPHKQGLRHEWLSVLMAWDKKLGLREWLRSAAMTDSGDDLDYFITLWAVSGHHPAYGRPSPPRFHVEGAGQQLEIYFGHRDLQLSLEWIGEQFGLSSPPELDDFNLPLIGSQNAFQRLFAFYRESVRRWQPLVDSPGSEQQETVRFVAAVKNCLIAADIAGSALPQEIESEDDRLNWIESGFERKPSEKDYQTIIGQRLDVAPDKIDEALRPFQTQVGESDSRITFVKAGCGCGKTIAAYEWARRQCPGKRLYICYPTTGTATEGFRDYLVRDGQVEDGSPGAKSGTPKFGAKLFHSREDIDFEILGIGTVSADGEGGLNLETAIRVESLDAWSTPIACCTCDAVLGLVQHNRRGLYGWPALAGAAFVFDEIHAYDDRLFGALLRFISALRGVKILLMTASLPSLRRRALDNCLERSGESLQEVPGPRDLEELPRYHWESLPDDGDPLPQITAELNERSGKVLWVCNTVNRAINAFQQARDAGLAPILYHSRYRYADRVARHKAVIDAFNPKKHPGPALAICTQVAEMSLDLSATMLVTDLAPVPSLIQRLGRLNRRAMPPKKNDPNPTTMPFVIVEPVSEDGTSFHLPYSPEDFELTHQWLGELPQTAISQWHLAEQWESLPGVDSRRPAYVPSAWLDGGPVTDVLELREGSPGLTVLQEADAEQILERQDRRRTLKGKQNKDERRELTKQIRRLFKSSVIPMPPPPKWIRDRLLASDNSEHQLNGVFVMDSSMVEYNAERGAAWQSEKP